MIHSIMNKTGITGWNDVILDVLLKWHMKCEVETWYGENGDPATISPSTSWALAPHATRMKGRS